MTEQRRLAAIVSADVMGYSRLMGRDEGGTLAALKAVRQEVVDPAIGRASGAPHRMSALPSKIGRPKVVSAGDRMEKRWAGETPCGGPPRPASTSWYPPWVQLATSRLLPVHLPQNGNGCDLAGPTMSVTAIPTVSKKPTTSNICLVI